MVESRGADRIEIEASASFRRGAGLAQSATVADLTRNGCRIVDIPRSLSRGERVALRIANVGPIAAHVRWLKLGREAGIEFDYPLSEAIYAVLAGDKQAKTLAPYRAEIMELHNSAVADVHDSEDAGETAEAASSLPAPEADAVGAPDETIVPITPQVEHDGGREQRLSTRFSASKDPAMCVDPESGPVEVHIVDFSQHGLRVGHDGIAAEPGTRISLVFPDNQVVDGEVRWNDGKNLGVRVVDFREDSGPAPQTTPDLPAADNLPPAEMASDEVDQVEGRADHVPAPADGDEGTLSQTMSAAAGQIAEQSDSAIPDLPEAQLARFARLLEVARACDFVTVKVRADADSIVMELTMKDPD